MSDVASLRSFFVRCSFFRSFVRSARPCLSTRPPSLFFHFFASVTLCCRFLFQLLSVQRASRDTERQRRQLRNITSAVLITSCLFVTFSKETPCCCTALLPISTGARRANHRARWNVSIGCTRKFSDPPSSSTSSPSPVRAIDLLKKKRSRRG